ncbi:MAG: response regulator [Leptospiraceae bacterium]|nr:response regulator [Leptospiraceae bacterium]
MSGDIIGIQSIDYLEDSNGSLTIDDVLNPESSTATNIPIAWQPHSLKHTPNFGFSDSAYWLEVRLDPCPETHCLLEIAYPPLDDVRLYLIPDGRLNRHAKHDYVQYHTGDLLPVSSRPIHHRNYVFRIDNTMRPVAYMRVRSESVIKLPIAYFTPDGFQQHNRNMLWWMGAFSGAMLILAAFNSVIWFILREPPFLYLVLFACINLLYFFLWNGFAALLFKIDEQSALYLNFMNPLLIAVSPLAIIQFVRSFLHSRMRHRKLDWFLIGLIPPCLIGVALVFTGVYTWPMHISMITGLILTFIGIPWGIMLFIRGHRHVRVLLLALAVPAIIGVLNALRVFDFIAAGFFSDMTGFQLGSIVQMLMFSLALTDRFRLVEQEKEMAARASASKTIFLANMSHEIRTPLHAIQGALDMLTEEEPQLKDNNYLSIMRRANESLLAIINDILDISRIESGRLELHTTLYKPAEILETVTAFILPAAARSGVAVAHYIDPNVPEFVQGDSMRIRQVLLNLASNARKFTEKGHILMELLRDKQQSNRMVFRVSDTGSGIQPHRLRHIFDPFVQEDPEIARRYGGAGLGLTICRNLVELMGGYMQVESTPGTGSTFSAVLPLHANESAAQSSGIDSTASSANYFSNENGTSDSASPIALLCAVPEPHSYVLRKYLGDFGCRIYAFEDDGELPVFAELADSEDDIETAQKVYVFYYTNNQDDFISQSTRWSALPAQLQKTIPGHVPVRYVQLISRYAPRVDTPNQSDADTVRLSLPIQRVALESLLEERSTQAPTEVATPSSGEVRIISERRLRILLAEDNEDNQLLFQAFIRKTDHDLIIAADGKIALHEFQNRPYDLAFIDIQMPVMDGLTAVRQMRRWEAHAIRTGQRERTCVIYTLTANTLHDDRLASLDAGCDGHIGKPVSREKILAVIAGHASGHYL